MLHSSSFEFDSSSDKIAVIAAFEDGGLCGVMVVDALVPVVIEVNISEEAVVGDSSCGLVVPDSVLVPFSLIIETVGSTDVEDVVRGEKSLIVLVPCFGVLLSCPSASVSHVEDSCRVVSVPC